MDVNKHIKVLKTIGASASNLMCQSCGLLTPAIGQLGVCHSCESTISMSRDGMVKRSPDLVAALDGINADIKANRYDDAIAAYEALIKKDQDPSLVYAEALVYTRRSNYEIAQISYDREGFMEENTEHRNNAARYAAASRLLLNKAASLCNTALSENEAQGKRYTAFMAYVKLGDYKAARALLDAMAAEGDGYMHKYAAMVFCSATGRFDEMVMHAEELSKPSSFSINAFFYIALALLKRRERKQALRLLAALKEHIDSDAIEALEKEAGKL